MAVPANAADFRNERRLAPVNRLCFRCGEIEGGWIILVNLLLCGQDSEAPSGNRIVDAITSRALCQLVAMRTTVLVPIVATVERDGVDRQQQRILDAAGRFR